MVELPRMIHQAVHKACSAGTSSSIDTCPRQTGELLQV